MSGRARTALNQRTRLRLPIRLKLAVVSAGLTFVILLLFALVVGALTEQKLRSSFNDDLRATAADLQEQLRVQRDLSGELRLGGDRGHAAGGRRRRRQRSAWSTAQGDVLDQTPAARPTSARPSRAASATWATSGWWRDRCSPASLDRSGSFNLDRAPIGRRGVRAVRQAAREPPGHPRPAPPLPGARRSRRHRAGLPRRLRRRPPRDAPDRRSHAGRARGGPHARPGRSRCPSPEANDEVAELADTLEDMLRELDAARSETEAALERQREFVADASHELRTPLTSILANLELLEEELDRSDGPRDREAAAEIAGSALRSSQRMRRLVGDLLLLARADAAPVATGPTAPPRRCAGPSTWAPWRATPRPRRRRCAPGTT